MVRVSDPAASHIVPPTPGPELAPPPFVTAGPYALQRTPGDFPDELVYVGRVAPGYDAWLKSQNLLSGPWEWVIQQDGDPIDISVRRFPKRQEAADDLVRALELLLPDSTGETAPVLAAGAVAPIAAPLVAADVDPGVMALALDIAILTLQRARSSVSPVAMAR